MAKTTYKTTKDAVGGGYTTRGDDGTTYKTTKDAIGGGYTTTKVSGPSKSSGSFEGAGSGFGGGIMLFVIALCVVQMCFNVLSPVTYVYIAIITVAPMLFDICDKLHVSRVWCSGVLFCYSSFCLVNSVWNDVNVVAGTRQGYEGLIVLLVLAIVMLLAFVSAFYSLGDTHTGILGFFVMFISVAWLYFNGFARIPYTYEMTRYSLIIMIVLAVIDQIILLIKKE